MEGPQEIKHVPSTEDEGVSSTRSLGPVSRDNLTPAQGADTPAKGCSAPDERKVYEEQPRQKILFKILVKILFKIII